MNQHTILSGRNIFYLGNYNNKGKFDTMINSHTSILDQYHHEHLTWQRTLDFFKQENAFLKTRLSEVLDHNTDKQFLPLAEHFQNQFIIKDEFIDELKHDVNELQQVFTATGNSKDAADKKMAIKQTKLRNEMEYFEKNFSGLRNEFNKYLVSIL